LSGIDLQDILKEFPNGVRAVDGVTLKIEDGEFIVLVGPSGCGKTTLLRCIAGLEEVTDGAVLIGDRDVTDVAPKDRDIAMVFQNYALYPHMTVFKNLAYGLRQRRTPNEETQRRVQEVAELLGLGELLKRRPGQLSGGQRQRVAMGRALVRNPAVFLLDEPLSNLDAKLRAEMRTELKRLHQNLPVTTIYVTHDQVEAMTLGDHIAVMREGTLQQFGTPQEVYDHPANVFVAGFIGSPPMNILRGVASGGRVSAGDFALVRPGVPDGDVMVGLRPQALRPASDGMPALDFKIDVVEPLGDEVVLHGTAATTNAVACVDSRVRPTAGSVLRLGIDPADVHVFHADSGLAIR
jgi:ABC-type sugar transport system ATPase subunit